MEKIGFNPYFSAMEFDIKALECEIESKMADLKAMESRLFVEKKISELGLDVPSTKDRSRAMRRKLNYGLKKATRTKKKAYFFKHWNKAYSLHSRQEASKDVIHRYQNGGYLSDICTEEIDESADELMSIEENTNSSEFIMTPQNIMKILDTIEKECWFVGKDLSFKYIRDLLTEGWLHFTTEYDGSPAYYFSESHVYVTMDMAAILQAVCKYIYEERRP